MVGEDVLLRLGGWLPWDWFVRFWLLPRPKARLLRESCQYCMCDRARMTGNHSARGRAGRSVKRQLVHSKARISRFSG